MLSLVLAILLIPVVISALLQIGAVQNFLAKKAAAYLSSQTGIEITIGKFRITDFFDLTLKDVHIADHHDSTLFHASVFTVDIGRIRLKDHVLGINHIFADNVSVMLRKYENDSVLNLDHLLSFFKKNDTTTVAKPWTISCKMLQLYNSRFLYQDRNKELELSPSVNYTNLMIDSLDLVISHFLLLKDTIFANIHQLNFKEQCGMKVCAFNTNLKFHSGEINAYHTKLRTNRSDLDMDLLFSFDGFSAFSDFLNDVTLHASIRSSRLSVQDLTYFVPSMKEFTHQLELSGDFRGTVSSMKIRNLLLFYGNETNLFGDVSISGLPDIRETFIHLKINDCYTSIADLQQLINSGISKKTQLPENLYPLGAIHIKGRFTGFINDFVSDASFRTELGTVTTDLALKPVSGGSDIQYKGRIGTHHFDLGRITGLDEVIGAISLHADITGTGATRQTARIFIQGTVDSAVLKNHQFQTIYLNGEYSEEKFNGSVIVDDPLIDLNFNGLADFRGKFPQFDFAASIRNAHLHELGLIPFDSVGILSTHMKFLLGGTSLDSSFGRLTLDSTVFLTSHSRFFMKNFNFGVSQEGVASKSITLASDYIQGEINGKFYLQEIYPMVASLIEPHVTSVLPDSAFRAEELSPQEFSFNLHLTDTEPFTDIFVPDLHIAPNTSLSGTIGYPSGEINVRLISGGIIYHQMKCEDLFAGINICRDNIMVTVETDNFIFKEPQPGDTTEFGIENILLSANVVHDSLSLSIDWDDETLANFNTGCFKIGLILDQLPRFYGNISQGDFVVNGYSWEISPGNSFVLDSTFVKIDRLRILGEGQALTIGGTLSDRPEETLTVGFEQFGLDNFRALLVNSGITLDGTAQGTFTVADIYHNPTIVSDLVVDEFALNGEILGDLVIKTDWDNTSRQINALSEIIYTGNDTSSKVLTVSGTYRPSPEASDNLDFTIKAENLKIKPIGQFLKGALEGIGGYASGILYLNMGETGPQLTGKMSVRRGQLSIGYLKTRYTFSDDIYFEPDHIGFNRLTVYDTTGSKAIVNGRIYHRFFKDFALDLEILPDNLLSMNTTVDDNSYFYGSARASGRVTIKGPANKLAFNIMASTDKGTAMYMPISYTADVSENTFIVFMNKEDTTDNVKAVPSSSTGLDLDMEIQVNDNASISIFLPMQMGNIKVSGEGLMKFNMAPTGEIGLNGTYMMNRGSFYFNLRNLFSRTFYIKPGSTIAWNGDIYGADINLQAVYPTKPSLATLPTTSLTDSSLMGQRVPVDCIIGLTGDLFNPTIRFRLEMPDVKEEEIRTLVYNSIDTTNDAQLTQQIMSLLVLNSFTASSSSNVASSMGLNSYELLTNQLNSWLNQISDDFDIGLNYQKGTSMSPEQVEVALSTQLFNDRILVSGNFGVGTYGESEKTSNIVGDVLVEAKITEDGRFRVRAYNKTNTYDLFNDNAPYTQGVGISYRKDFNRFRDIFTRQRKKTKTNVSELPE